MHEPGSGRPFTTVRGPDVPDRKVHVIALTVAVTVNQVIR